jgi:hypothetical protein
MATDYAAGSPKSVPRAVQRNWRHFCVAKTSFCPQVLVCPAQLSAQGEIGYFRLCRSAPCLGQPILKSTCRLFHKKAERPVLRANFSCRHPVSPDSVDEIVRRSKGNLSAYQSWCLPIHPKPRAGRNVADCCRKGAARPDFEPAGHRIGRSGPPSGRRCCQNGTASEIHSLGGGITAC